MISIKFNYIKIVKSAVYSFVLISSVCLMSFKIYKYDFKKLLRIISDISVRMTIPASKKSEEIVAQIDDVNAFEKEEFDEEEFDEVESSECDKEKKTDNEYDKKNSKVLEIQMGKSGIKCGNFYIKNKTGKNIDFEKYLSRSPKINVRKKSPVVLIYHTHTTESYMGSSSDSRTQNKTKNIVSIGDEICKKLKEHGIKCIHDDTVHDYPNYNGAYTRSAKTLRECIKKNPGLQLIIDLHRDSMGDNKSGKIKPVFTTKNNKKSAQIMFVSGCGIDKSLNFPNWEKNLSLSLNLQNVCEKCFPGLTREFLIKNSRYNQNISPGSVLIEIGSDANSLDEAKEAARMLGESLAIFFKRYLK